LTLKFPLVPRLTYAVTVVEPDVPAADVADRVKAFPPPAHVSAMPVSDAKAVPVLTTAM
jgi:hypothetical protein